MSIDSILTYNPSANGNEENFMIAFPLHTQIITCSVKLGMNLLTHSQTVFAALLKFSNEQLVSY